MNIHTVLTGLGTIVAVISIAIAATNGGIEPNLPLAAAGMGGIGLAVFAWDSRPRHLI